MKKINSTIYITGNLGKVIDWSATRSTTDFTFGTCFSTCPNEYFILISIDFPSLGSGIENGESRTQQIIMNTYLFCSLNCYYLPSLIQFRFKKTMSYEVLNANIWFIINPFISRFLFSKSTSPLCLSMIVYNLSLQTSSFVSWKLWFQSVLLK